MLHWDLQQHRKEFWGSEPSARERRAKMQNALQAAREEYDEKVYRGDINPTDYKKKLFFKMGDVELCEKAFVNLLGLATVTGFKTRVWREEVDIFLGKRSRKSSYHTFHFIIMCCLVMW